MSKLLSVPALVSFLFLSALTLPVTSQTISWKLLDPHLVGGYTPVMLGKPILKAENKDNSIYFNGINDGLIIPTIPIEGWSKFTIEVLFKPEGDGSLAPRFIHFEDSSLNRGTFELRLTKDGYWYLDAFLKNGTTNKGLALIDSTKLHPINQWCWAAMVYDGKKMRSYINGQKELEGEIDFPAMTQGRIALGVRLNKIYWYKGLIREIRFHPVALDTGGTSLFQKIK